jgi:hypothetical protein
MIRGDEHSKEKKLKKRSFLVQNTIQEEKRKRGIDITKSKLCKESNIEGKEIRQLKKELIKS